MQIVYLFIEGKVLHENLPKRIDWFKIIAIAVSLIAAVYILIRFSSVDLNKVKRHSIGHVLIIGEKEGDK